MNVVQHSEKKHEHRVKNFNIRLDSFTDLADWNKAYQAYTTISDTVTIVKFGVRDVIRKTQYGEDK